MSDAARPGTFVWIFAGSGANVVGKVCFTLMKRMGIKPIYRWSNTSKPAPCHNIYPYLLRGLKIKEPNHIWVMDITHICMARSFMRLAAAVDGFSRRALSHRVLITMDVDFYVKALEEALAKHRMLQIFNTQKPVQQLRVLRCADP